MDKLCKILDDYLDGAGTNAKAWFLISDDKEWSCGDCDKNKEKLDNQSKI